MLSLQLLSSSTFISLPSFSFLKLFLNLCFLTKAASLYKLEEENHEAATSLEDVVYRGDMLLEKIQSALADIAQSQLKTRSGTHSQSLPDS